MTLAEFRTLFRTLYPSLALYATKIVGHDEVEDIVQDAFMEYWRRRDNILEVQHVRAFLFRSVYTHAVNVLKHKYVIGRYAKEYVELENKRMQYYHPDNNNVETDLENSELKQIIDKTIDELPEKRRQIFRMGYIHGMSNREIADIMGISVRTVEVHMYKALKYMRTRLKDLIYFLLFIFLQYVFFTS